MEEIQHNPSDIHSFLVNQVLHANIVDLSRKRKILDTQLSLPIRKLKFRDGFPGSKHSSLFIGEPDAEDVPQTWIMKVNSNTLHHEVESLELDSGRDSSSFVEELDCAMSQYTEAKSVPEFPKVCTHDQQANSKRDFPEVYPCDKPSTSFGSCGSNNSINPLYSLDNRSLKKVRVGEEEVSLTEEQHLEFGYHTDYMCSDYGTGEIEESPNVESPDVESDMMLYSNGTSSDLFVLSSGRWKINQDSAQGGTRKPTIDQEFEQYFSMLML